MKRAALWLILLVAFCGIANSSYIARSEATGTPLICNITGLSGCNIVAQSPYSHLFGISLAEYGIAYFGLLFILAAAELVAANRPLRRLIQALGVLGLVASIVFEAIQFFLIGALCVYCAASAVLALLAFVFACFIEPVRRSYSPPPTAA
ncbi:MAG TPA: vitamin K epoxide reductase family protein [Candidatus Paceibacterota bacterium]|nr:vitamin K epoxide reductase family protein [Candidatus Paceibacterota bacterium]